MSRLDQLCTFHRDGQWCGRTEEDKSVHVSEDERMRRGAHIFRHERRDAVSLAAALVPAVIEPPEYPPDEPRSPEYERGYQAGYHAGQRSRQRGGTGIWVK